MEQEEVLELTGSKLIENWQEDEGELAIEFFTETENYLLQKSMTTFLSLEKN